MNDEGISGRINAVANLAKAVPVYDDALRPIAIQTGKALETVGKAVNVALMPLRGLVWGADEVENWLKEKVSRKLEGVDDNDIVTPDLAIAGPIIEALKYQGQKPELSELFASLMASAMHAQSSASVHPAFIDFVRQMGPLEARIIASLYEKGAVPSIDAFRKSSNFEGRIEIIRCFSPPLGDSLEWPEPLNPLDMQMRIENLDRMGLVRVSEHEWLAGSDHAEQYEAMENHSVIQDLREKVVSRGQTVELQRSCINLTVLGRAFGACALRAD